MCSRFIACYQEFLFQSPRSKQSVLSDNNEENSRPVAPNTQHINDQDLACKTKPSELFGCFDKGSSKEYSQCDIFNDTGILPRSNDEEELQQNRISDSDYRKLVCSLNKKQREFFFHVLHSIKTKDDPLRLFLSGGAGVVKSTVTNALYQALDRYLNSIPGENPDNIKVLKRAPTGKAAFNIKGNTLHSAFNIPVNRGFSFCTLDRDRLNSIRTPLRKLQVIFIDEISMVGIGMFNFLNLRLQQITDTNRPFGGLSIIAVGDLYQLQPVFDKWIFERGNDVYSTLPTNIWKEYFSMFELTEIMRQKDDKDFAELLNRLREGKQTQDDITVLKSRVLKSKPGEPNYPASLTHVFSTNVLVNTHNEAVFNLSQSAKAQIDAIDIVIGDISDELKDELKRKIPDDPSKTMGLYKKLDITVGSKYDLTLNVDVSDGLTNRAECVVQDIDYRVVESQRPSIIWVTFSDASIGNKQRREYSFLFKDKMENLTPIFEITRQFKISNRNQLQVLRRQFPLRAAAAKTIHRCQGDTLNELVVDLPSTSRDHMHYVALSRARNISRLHILNLNKNKISVSQKVSEEMHTLRSQPLEPCIPSLYKQTLTDTFKIVFHNVTSLHHEDVASDFNIQEADLIICVETSLCSLDSSFHYQIDGFNLFRNDYCPNSNIRTCYGTAVYVKDTLTCLTTPTRCNINDVEITVTSLKDPIPKLHVIGIYRSKNKVAVQVLIHTLKLLLDALLPESFSTTPVVILGDFNVNLLEESSDKKKLQTYFQQERQFAQIISQCTTDYHSLLDHIYTNIPAQVEDSGTLESYFSDHKPIFVCLRHG